MRRAPKTRVVVFPISISAFVSVGILHLQAERRCLVWLLMWPVYSKQFPLTSPTSLISTTPITPSKATALSSAASLANHLHSNLEKPLCLVDWRGRTNRADAELWVNARGNQRPRVCRGIHRHIPLGSSLAFVTSCLAESLASPTHQPPRPSLTHQVCHGSAGHSPCPNLSTHSTHPSIARTSPCPETASRP